MRAITYKEAGVDIAAGNETVERIKPLVKNTFSNQVLTGIGSFGALFDIQALAQDYQHPILVQSIDGVGTKTKIAKLMDSYHSIGIDLVSATANDILVMGAKPLTLLDYIATDSLQPKTVEAIVAGMAQACQEEGISLVGGETAEMPGTYLKGEHDLVGVVTGVVEKEAIISGEQIQAGDKVYGLASSGLHTNGYSLARKLFFEVANLDVDHYMDELQSSVGEALLTPHLNYCKPILHCLEKKVAIHGMAHITGGGLLENIPRILPAHCGVRLQKDRWPIPPLFLILQTLGKLSDADMAQTFNLGIGLIIIVPESAATELESTLQPFKNVQLYLIGEVEAASQPNVRIE